jgi:hypothetical protein
VWRKEGACASKRASRGAIHFSTSTKNLTSFGALEKAHILSSVSWIEQISFRPIDIVLSDQKNPSLRPSIHQFREIVPRVLDENLAAMSLQQGR